MGEMSTITAELDTGLLADLDRLVQAQHRTRDAILGTLVADYLREAAAFDAFLQEAEDQIDRGECYAQDEVEAVFAARRGAAAAE